MTYVLSVFCGQVCRSLKPFRNFKLKLPGNTIYSGKLRPFSLIGIIKEFFRNIKERLKGSLVKENLKTLLNFSGFSLRWFHQAFESACTSYHRIHGNFPIEDFGNYQWIVFTKQLGSVFNKYQWVWLIEKLPEPKKLKSKVNFTKVILKHVLSKLFLTQNLCRQFVCFWLLLTWG